MSSKALLCFGPSYWVETYLGIAHGESSPADSQHPGVADALRAERHRHGVVFKHLLLSSSSPLSLLLSPLSTS